MTHHLPTLPHVVVIDETLEFTLVELSQACHVDSAQLEALVSEGVLAPSGSNPADWRFDGPSLRRSRLALRLGRDLELNAAGAALVVDLLDRIEGLSARLRRLGAR